MYPTEIKQFLNTLKQSNGSFSSSKIRRFPTRNPDKLVEILNKTNFLPEGCSFMERVYVIENDIIKRQRCKCGKYLRYLRKERRYSYCCSNQCEYYKKRVTTSYKNTMKSKYGVENSFQLESVKKKSKDTLKKKYGVDHALQYKKFKDKASSTFIDRFGKDPNKHPDLLRKTKTTCLERYGVDNPSKSSSVKRKKEKTTLKNYGVINPFQSEDIKGKIKKRLFKKCGTNHHSRRHLSSKVKEILADKKRLVKVLVFLNHKKGWSLSDIADLFGITDTNVGRYFRKLNIEIKYNYNRSRLEREVYNHIKSLVITECIIERNYRLDSNLELDLYLPEKDLAIEVHGLYWHSSNNVTEDLFKKKRHQDKFIECNDNNIRLFQILETEWRDPIKRDIWKSILQYYIEKDRIRNIYGRKCVVQEIKPQQAEVFFNSNHLQGHLRSSVYIGLFFEGDLVSAMSFTPSRFNKKYEWEMGRYATKKYTSVVGGASKLFKHFTRVYSPKSVVSYADTRYSVGNLYDKLGFLLIHLSNPNYFYFRNMKEGLKSRVSFQKHKLINKLGKYDPLLTEVQNMFNNGYRRFWDSGNLVYVWVETNST